MVIEDLGRTRGLALPAELLEAAVRHPSRKVVLAAVQHHRLTPDLKAEMMLRPDLELRPDPDTFFRRREIGLHLGDGRNSQ